VLQLTIQLLDQVARLRAATIIHRDLHPANIIIDASGRAHLIDFGWASLPGQADLSPSSRLIRDHEAELASPRSMRWTLSWAHARHTPGEPSVARSFRPGWGRRSEDSRRAVRQLWRRFLGCSA
jgi:serine/threonine protein kinase